MNYQFGQPLVMSSFTPITLEEATKFIEVSYGMAKAENPELPDKPKIVFTAGWYQTIETELG